MRIIDNNPPLSVQEWPRARFDALWHRTACYPTVNLKATPTWRTLDNRHYLFRSERLLGCFNPDTQAYWSWDGKTYATAPPPWRK